MPARQQAVVPSLGPRDVFEYAMRIPAGGFTARRETTFVPDSDQKPLNRLCRRIGDRQFAAIDAEIPC